MFNTILVAVDESEAAKEAGDLAVKLALEDHAGLVLVNVLDVGKLITVAGYDSPYPAQTIDIMRESAQQLLNDTKAACEAKGLKVVTAVGEGDATDEIVRLADEHSAGLICIGTHGRQGLARLFVGSVAEGVLRNANVPVLVVRPTSKQSSVEGSGKTAAAKAR
ncbi:MAG: universal stress protein [Candidatus Aquilonibacter sp.]